MDEKEKKILDFWKENNIFEKSLQKDSPQGGFVFYDGPVTANAKPVFHTMEPFAFKDIIPRYKTMRGYHVLRKGGWDTHGLPVELQVEKKLGFTSKKDIENYGIAAFNKLCKESVWEYIGLWKDFTKRMGYWADQEDPYITYDNSYIESLWNIVKEVHNKKLLYKDYKVLPWCPRCGTALSSHELAQGYQDDKDLAITVKFKVENPKMYDLPENTYIIAWTTTPWTLPGNVALAVGKDVLYGCFQKNNETLIASYQWINQQREFSISPEAAPAGKDFKGSDLVGLKYEPPFKYQKNHMSALQWPNQERGFEVYSANFVNTEDGTGIVHIAPMYGQDDFELAIKENLPKMHTVLEDGTFKFQGYEKKEKFLSERFVKEVDKNGKPTLAIDIINYLKEENLFFDQKNIRHSYPHCWRCKTPLIYYARDSWYIAMSKLREELMKENESIHWEPEHIKEGRFGEWLREIKDWAVSRERYWGTPLPVWQDAAGDFRVIGSIAELRKHTKSNGNKFIFVRHGEAENNVKDTLNCDPSKESHLTERGQKGILEAAKKIKTADVIYTSPYMRTKETAGIIAAELKISEEKIIEDERLVEFGFGDFNGKSMEEYYAYEAENLHTYDTKMPNGESYQDAKLRFGRFLYEIDAKHSGETIVVVTHGIGLEVIAAVIEGADMRRSKEIIDSYTPEPAGVLEFDFIPLPHNENYELDLHRPFIDEISLVDEKGAPLTRVKEVMDVWFDSGGMPFAQNHYPFKEESLLYPADYIAEAIDQTRGWFYTLHAIGVLLGKGKAFKNVICLGHVLDAQGKKMSKSLGNILEPMAEIQKYGADALRLWMYSVNQPGDSKNFDGKTVDEIIKKVFNPLLNILSFFEMYSGGDFSPTNESKHVLDRWIVSRIHELLEDGTKALDGYKIFEAARAIRDFANDFSTWYVRRSRDRFKSEDGEEKAVALGTTRFVFLELVKYMAPFTPFFAESVYQKLKENDGKESIHLESWSSSGNIDRNLLSEMQKAREVVSIVLDIRQKANIKVRQPLASLVVPNAFAKELLDIIADEINVKEVKVGGDTVTLDTELTPELVEEGKVRDAIRSIQEWRKEQNLKPGEKATYTVPEKDREFFLSHSEEIKKITSIEF